MMRLLLLQDLPPNATDHTPWGLVILVSTSLLGALGFFGKWLLARIERREARELKEIEDARNEINTLRNEVQTLSVRFATRDAQYLALESKVTFLMRRSDEADRLEKLLISLGYDPQTGNPLTRTIK